MLYISDCPEGCSLSWSSYWTPMECLIVSELQYGFYLGIGNSCAAGGGLESIRDLLIQFRVV